MLYISYKISKTLCRIDYKMNSTYELMNFPRSFLSWHFRFFENLGAKVHLDARPWLKRFFEKEKKTPRSIPGTPLASGKVILFYIQFTGSPTAVDRYYKCAMMSRRCHFNINRFNFLLCSCFIANSSLLERWIQETKR